MKEMVGVDASTGATVAPRAVQSKGSVYGLNLANNFVKKLAGDQVRNLVNLIDKHAINVPGGKLGGLLYC